MTSSCSDQTINEWPELNFGENRKREDIEPVYLAVSQIDEAKHFFKDLDGEISAHHELLRAVAAHAAQELDPWINWINAQSMPGEANFLFYFDDSPIFDAYIFKPVRNSKAHEYAIIINLGCIPFLVGAANRLAVSELTSLSGWSGALTGRFDAATHGWDPSIDPLGILTFDPSGSVLSTTVKTAVDALVLMFLHEVTHGCRAHLVLKASLVRSPPIHRALESEADWGASYLAVLGSREEIYISPGCVDAAFLERQVAAALCNFVGFQFHVNLDRTAPNPYYLPYTRLICTLEGLDQACKETFEQPVDIVDTLNGILAKYIALEIDFPEIYTGWISQADQRAVDDLDEHTRQSDVLLSDLHGETEARSFSPLRGITRRIRGQRRQ